MPAATLRRLRSISLALPDAHEVEAWEAPTFRVNNKIFAMYIEEGNDHGGHESVWIKSTQINQSLLLTANPKRFFSPPYVGPSGWIGVRLDGRVNWTELRGLLQDGYELAAPKAKSRGAARSAPSSSRKRPRSRRATKR
jgi:hypothetical protein